MRRSLSRSGFASISACVVVFTFLLPQAGADAQNRQQPPARSASTGVGLALASTLVPATVSTLLFIRDAGDEALAGTLMAYAVAVGPFPGNVYANDLRRGLVGMALRVGAGAAFMAVAMGMDEGSGGSGHAALALVSMAAGVGVTAWNIATIPSAVRRFNERVAVSPTLGLNGRIGARMEIQW